MATQPDNNRTEEAAALALLLAGRRYNLPALIRQQKIRARPFRRIKPTEALRANMAAPFFAIVRAWLEQKPALLAAYASARATGDAAAMQRAVDQAEQAARQALIAAPSRIQSALGTLERWHRGQWTQRIKASTGLDVGMLTSPQDVQPEVSNTTTWSAQLAQSVHQDTHAKVGAAFLAALVALKPPADVNSAVVDVLAKAKRRAAGIGVDQTDKASAGMTRARSKAAGLSNWMWQHNTEIHYRPEHKARNGKIFNDSNAPNDMPSVLPFCRCAQIPLWE
jgi:SPP1 gp7 family putative phage head morphogenesis protein